MKRELLLYIYIYIWSLNDKKKMRRDERLMSACLTTYRATCFVSCTGADNNVFISVEEK